jgi:hypothetical protein
MTFSEMTRWSLQRLLTPRRRAIVCVYTRRDHRFVQEMQDQSIKRGSSVKELGEQGATRGAAKKLQQMAAVGWTAVIPNLPGR